ncbi:hypothetical protein NCCP2716_13190 [Sporosarcina sp. NCCP-2716]|uniref:copper homeostasis protein CutC n=1 Tax=Sporosarcina sp. NCCP-2716 TaxID=2943679 RepID=UPI00203A5891|nr:copper homeostasis protein CutC [Sporosarcina sp. NCCP-2716]GKV68821.1 hypothetical protein NCCP2716_13190 [Sporosarcina sp. NCCP-2716]
MLLEVIATSVEDALTAEQAGADRLELCAALTEGGLTPSLGLIEEVVGAVDIPVHVIVRPHSRSFVYSEADMQVMLSDIGHIRRAGAAGIVIGVLDDENHIDTVKLERLIQAAEGLNITFHRAFDEIADQLGAVGVLASYPEIQRVLTSGGKAPAPQSVQQLKRLAVKAAGTSLTILAGHGMTAEGLDRFLENTGITEVHFGSGIRFGNSFNQPIDPQVIRQIVG